MNEALQAILRTNIVIGHVFAYVYRFGLGSQKKKKSTNPKECYIKMAYYRFTFTFLKLGYAKLLQMCDIFLNVITSKVLDETYFQLYIAIIHCVTMN